MKHVNILGTEYHIEYKSIADDPYLKGANGYTDPTAKKIVIGNKERDCEIEDFENLQRKVIRHEIIHAYFEESGISTSVENIAQGVPELYVDWFAMQAPKIYKTYAELNVLDVDMDAESMAAEVFADYIDRAGTTALARGMRGDIRINELAALIQGEVAELLAEFVAGHIATETIYEDDGKPTGVPSELADIVIYCIIMADLYHIDLVTALNEKMAYNVVRAKREVK